MSKIYCPQCGHETAQYTRDVFVKLELGNGGPALPGEKDGEYELHT